MNVDLTVNANRFEGKANVSVYDTFRPKTPPDLITLIVQYLKRRPHHVIDIGCGSGLSTMGWLDQADRITCVEPSVDMLSAAKDRLNKSDKTVDFISAFAHNILLPGDCADVITVSQAFHWMNPEPTIKEVQRLLKPGGLFVVYDCMWPPSCGVVLENAFIDLFDGILKISKQQPKPLMHFWSKADHKSNIEKFGDFNFIKEVGFHQMKKGNADYFIGLAESQGGLQALRKLGMSDEIIGWDAFREVVNSEIGEQDIQFGLHYQAIICVL